MLLSTYYLRNILLANGTVVSNIHIIDYIPQQDINWDFVKIKLLGVCSGISIYFAYPAKLNATKLFIKLIHLILVTENAIYIERTRSNKLHVILQMSVLDA